jgi:hypothetical protein
MEIKKNFKQSGQVENVEVTIKSQKFNEPLTMKIHKKKIFFNVMVDNAGNQWYINKHKLKELMEMV